MENPPEKTLDESQAISQVGMEKYMDWSRLSTFFLVEIGMNIS